MLSRDGFVLFPELEVIFGKRFDLERDLSNASYNFLKEDLEDRVRPCVLTTKVSGLLEKIIIFCVELVFLLILLQLLLLLRCKLLVLTLNLSCQILLDCHLLRASIQILTLS